MAKQSAPADGKPSIRQQLEPLVGSKVDVPEAQLRFLRWPVGAHNYDDGTVLWRGIIIQGQSCAASSLLDGSGVAASGANGQVTFLLSSYICLPLVRSLAEPVSLLATARTDKPFYVTLTHKMVVDPNVPQSFNDVEITGYAWDAHGAPAAGVAFDWRCRVVSNPIIL